MAGKFEIFQDETGQHRFHLKAGNGEIVLTGESYQQKSSCENGIESVLANAPLEERYEKKTSTGGEPYFVLKAANHQIIGESQMYSSESARDGGIDAVMRAADGAQVVEVEPKSESAQVKRDDSVTNTAAGKQQHPVDGRSPWLRR